MRQELLEIIKRIDKKAFKIMNKGIICSELVAFVAIIILYIYNKLYISYDLYLVRINII